MKSHRSGFHSGLMAFVVLLTVVSSTAYGQETQSIIAQAVAAHGGSMLEQVGSCQTTVLFADYRQSPSLPRPAVLKSFGKTTRLEYTDARGPATLIRNGAWLWEVRGGQAQEFAGQPQIFQNGYFNPSLGIVRNLSAQEFAYYSAATLRGHQFHLKKVDFLS